MRRFPTLVAAAVLLPGLATAQVRFEPGLLLASPGASGVAVGDFDGDGRHDLAAIDYQGRVTLQLQKTAGSFAAFPIAGAAFVVPSTGPLPMLATGDFNEDGRDDLVFSGGGGWRMFLSQPGDGWSLQLAPASRRSGVGAPLVFDIDRDGHLDIVQAEQLASYPTSSQLIGSALHLYFGDGDGGLVPRGVLDAGDANFFGMVAGHFNADPFIDIATAEGAAFMGDPVNLVLRHGHGGSGFSAPVRLSGPLRSFVAGDFDSDGRTDLVTTGFPGADGSRMHLYRQLPGGLYDAPRALSAAGNMNHLDRLDSDGDGDDDLVALADGVVSGTNQTWMLAYPQGGGQLQRPEQSEVQVMTYFNTYGQPAAVGDFDGDQREDVAVLPGDGIRLHLARPLVATGNGTLPLAPSITGVQTEPGLDDAYLTVARPAGNGGSPILGYRVVTAPAGLYFPPVQPQPGTQPFTIVLKNLPLGVAYRVQVQAYNAAGDGPLSAPVTVMAVPERTLRIDPYIYLPEGDAGPVVHQVPARLNWPAGPGGVRFDVVSLPPFPSQAEPGVHYEPVDLRGVFIPEGQTETTIPVVIVGNTIPDYHRFFMLRVENVTGARGSGQLSDVRIQTEEFAPSLPDLYGLYGEVVEGDSGQKLVPFRMIFDKPLSAPVVVGVYTDRRPNINFLALPPDDYDAAPIANFTVNPGDDGATIYIPVNGDTLGEPDEFVAILFYVISGPAQVAVNGGNYAITMIRDDDRIQPPLSARVDRIVLSQNTAVEVRPVTNDVYVAGRTQALKTAYPEPRIGELHFVSQGNLDVEDDALVFRAAPGFVGVHRQPYQLCEQPQHSRRCVVADIEFVVRPVPEIALAIEASASAGFRDIGFDGLQAMPGARFDTSMLVQPLRRDVLLSGDPDAISPWDAAAGTDVSLHSLPPPVDGRPRTWRALVDAAALSTGDVDLYLGVDTDKDGQAEPGELQCTAAMVPTGESCELDISQPGDAGVSYWVMLHNRGKEPLLARADIAAVRTDAPGDGSLVATGPGRLQGGEHFALRVAWNDASFLAGERRVGYLRVRTTANHEGDLVPVRLARAPDDETRAPIALASGKAHSFALPAASAHRRLFVDVPEGATSLAVNTRSGQAVDLYLVPAGAGSSPQIDEAPPVSAAVAASARIGGDEDVRVAAPPSGRWYLVVNNTGIESAAVEVTATISAAPPLVRPGSYFNPDRSGHGLVLYPAADQWVGIWYTYFQDGTPTWLYLQAPAPGSDGLWTAPIYRGAWNSVASHLVQVGTATVTPTGADAFRFTWTLDGETGSEPLQALGRGCPTLGSERLDASSHWFDPARAGTGYSVQAWPNYEMHLAFVYDSQGAPRFLIAEGSGFGGSSRVLPLEQLKGFCPLCARPGPPSRRVVGSFQRSFGNGTMQVGIDGIYAPAIPGWWTADDLAQLLGGPGTTQGCAP